MGLLRNDALRTHPYLRRHPKDSREWAEFIRALNDQSVVEIGAIVLSEFIRLGQTDYNTGTGFWLGDDNGTPKFSIGSGADNRLTWDGTTLSVSGQGTFQESRKGWQSATVESGFSDSSLGDVDFPFATYFYAEDQVAFVAFGVSATGTSNGSDFELSGIPSGIIPDAGSPVFLITAIDNGSEVLASVEVESQGGGTYHLIASIFDASSGTFDPNGWTGSGTKGFKTRSVATWTLDAVPDNF